MTTAFQTSLASSRAELNCMEIWGGRGNTESCLVRPGLDVWISSTSSKSVHAGGGEIHLLSSCASGRITRLLLADVCSPGSRFAELAEELKRLLKQNVNTIQQDRLLRRLGETLDSVSHRGVFASILVGSYFAPTRLFSICSAGYPQPLLRPSGADRWRALSRLRGANNESTTPLGVMDPREYQHWQLPMQVGDTALFLSNSLLEQRASGGRTVGLSGVLDCLDGIAGDGLSDIAQELALRIRLDNGRRATDDDSTVILCRATDARVSRRDNLFAPIRLLGSVADKTRFD